MIRFLTLMVLLTMASCYFDNFDDLNGGDSGECPEEEVSFMSDVLPLLQTHCSDIFCHGGIFPQGGINLESYEPVRVVALNGRLLGSVSHSAGYSPMPLNAGKLPPCDIQLIADWIEAGAPEN